MIKERSPKLHGLLRRNFDDSDLFLFESAFEYAAASGGLLEVDFERDPLASYNPRPARIAQIVFEDAQQTEADVLAAAILASSSDVSGLTAERFGSAGDIARKACELCPARLVELEPGADSAAAAIFAAMWLDRARHLHLAPPQRLAAVDEKFLNDTQKIASEFKRHTPRIAELVDAWLQRRLRQASR